MNASIQRNLAIAAGPTLFLLLFFIIPTTGLSKEISSVIALGAWMLTWWITEPLPIAITSLLPLIVLPALGISSMSETAQPYGDPVIFLFMGGFILALALEKYHLHQRIALNLIRMTGTSGNGIILGFMLATALISMWISNTATAIMMLPIAASVTNLIAKDLSLEQDDRFKNFSTGLMLAIAYASSIGGIATIIGTPPNVVMVGHVKRIYGTDVGFADWMIVGVPLMILALASCYLIITKILFRNRLSNIPGSKELIENKLKELGPVSGMEKKVLIIFGITSFLWIFKQLINKVIGFGLLDDTSIAILGAVLMFLLPAASEETKARGLLEWSDMKNMQWGILLLFGGGMALAGGMEKSGLVEKIGGYFRENQISGAVLIFSLTFISMALTELMSNVALVTIFVPVVFGIAEGAGINPIYLALPVTFAASCAFMMPISTPPNAILFASGYIKMKDMIKTGLLLNLFCLAIIFVLAITIMEAVF
ncbi:MAG: DASS family sodium-coupled anion symporter [Bacteroidetes bacterium]|nr:DASS family sodium-coupled anion symporter [Bacteroidota bacterium]